jgi:hypothetical protein
MIPFNKIGLIREGKNKGFFIKVVEDLDETGGYFVFYSKDFNKKEAEGYDDWFLEREVLENFINNDVSIDWV